MGVLALWPLLQSGGAVKTLDGSSKAGMVGIAKEVDGKKIAVDLSIWVFEASQQGSLAMAMEHEATRVVKVVFERMCTWLRFGITPVFVLEGSTASAKSGRLQWKQGANKQVAAMAAAASQQLPRVRLGQPLCQGPLGALHARVAALAVAMGLPVVQGAGEAEATCAALNAAGLVDAVHTTDSDTLLFGAQTVFRTLKLSYITAKACELTVCTMQDVRGKVLQLSSGGTAALRVVAALAGGDYNIAGVDKTGPGRSLEAVWGLLQATGADNDEGLSQALTDAMSTEPDAHLLSLNHCTGCKTCGHESGTKTSKASHGSSGCAACGTEHGCKPKPAGQECMCEFHRRKYERTLHRVLARAHQSPQLATAMLNALKEYEWQAQAAAQAVEEVQAEQLRWQHRPDVKAVFDVITQHTLLNWTEAVIRQKLRPVLIEWDLLQGSCGGQDVEWRPVAVQKVQGMQPSQYHSADADAAWRLVLTLERLPGKGSQQAEELDRAWLRGELIRVRGEDDVGVDETSTQLQATDQQQGEEQAAVYEGVPTQEYLQPPTQLEVRVSKQDDTQQGTQAYDAEEASAGGTQMLSQSQRPCSQQVLVAAGSGLGLAKAPTAAGAGKASGRSCPPPDQRTFRLSLVARHWPDLIRTFQQSQSKSKGTAKGRSKAKTAPVPTAGTVPGMFAALASKKAAAAAAAGGQSSQAAPTTPLMRTAGSQDGHVQMPGQQAASKAPPASHGRLRQATLNVQAGPAAGSQRVQPVDKQQWEKQDEDTAGAAAVAITVTAAVAAAAGAAGASSSSSSSSGRSTDRQGTAVQAPQPEQDVTREGTTSNLLARLRERKLRHAATAAATATKSTIKDGGLPSLEGAPDNAALPLLKCTAAEAVNEDVRATTQQLGIRVKGAGRGPAAVAARQPIVVDLITPPKQATVPAHACTQQQQQAAEVVDLCNSDDDINVGGQREGQGEGCGGSRDGNGACGEISPVQVSPGKRAGAEGVSSPSKRAVCRRILHDVS